MSIAVHISSLLKNRNIKQRILADYLGIADSTLSGWIKFERDIPNGLIIPICDFFKVSPRWLLTGEDKHSDDASVGSLLRMYLGLPAQQREVVYAHVKAAHDVYGSPDDPAKTFNQEVM